MNLENELISKMPCSNCNKEGHNKRTCKAPVSEEIVEPIVEPTVKKEIVEPTVEPIVKEIVEEIVKKPIIPVSSWYKIPEINKDTYLSLIRPLYDIIEGKKISKSEPDLFAKQGWMNFHNINEEQWEYENKKIQIQRVWTMAWGDFHQNLMGSFPGWENYKRGHITGCDIGKEDNTCVAEIKNNTNTMNSDSKKSVMKKLKKQKDLGKRSILVIINGDTNSSVKDGIETISGKHFYKELSGRLSFMDDILSTTNESFKLYKTFESLTTALEIV